jgi:CheY-like chemotaxis protein
MADEETRGMVLLVESDAVERERISTSLEDAGFEVTLCPGPSAPDYTCVGTRALECPLAKGASVVVLDMTLDGEDLMEGTAAEELLDVYILAGHRVIALARHLRDEIPGRSIRLPRHPRSEELISAVGSLATAPQVDVFS